MWQLLKSVLLKQDIIICNINSFYLGGQLDTSRDILVGDDLVALTVFDILMQYSNSMKIILTQ
jgi:hypothetical protein